MKNQITRQQYLNKEISHQEYYESLADTAGLSFGHSFISKVKQALNSGDENLNSIPLNTWDNMCGFDLNNPYLGTELKKRGDFYSLSCGVCMRKAKAKAMAEKL